MKLYYLHAEGSMPSELSQTKKKKKKKIKTKKPHTNTTWFHLYVDTKTKQKMFIDTKKRWGWMGLDEGSKGTNFQL